MSNKKAEKAAESYATGHGHGGTIPARLSRDIVDGLKFVRKCSFLEGRAHFIEHELPKLLELARECRPLITDDGSYAYSIDDIIVMAKEGET